MKLLLDTQVFLWFIMGSPRLSLNARKLIEDSTNEKWISIVSLWEIGIKVSIGKLRLSEPFQTLIPQQIDLNGFRSLAIKLDHISSVVNLPFYHRDPFDRLIIAQAAVEQMTIVSNDLEFDSYSVNKVW